MQYTTKDLQPVLKHLKDKGHGSKKELADSVDISQQQLSFYLRFKAMSPDLYKAMLAHCKPAKQTGTKKK